MGQLRIPKRTHRRMHDFKVKNGFRFGNVNITVLVGKPKEVGYQVGYQDLNIKRHLRVLVVNL